MIHDNPTLYLAIFFLGQILLFLSKKLTKIFV
jgi:hypothetical protein